MENSSYPRLTDLSIVICIDDARVNVFVLKGFRGCLHIEKILILTLIFLFEYFEA